MSASPQELLETSDISLSSPRVALSTGSDSTSTPIWEVGSLRDQGGMFTRFDSTTKRAAGVGAES